MEQRLVYASVLAMAVVGFTMAAVPREPVRYAAPVLDLAMKHAEKTEIPNFPYPNEVEMNSWKAAGASKEPEMRKHAWDIFAGLVLQGKDPLWSDWYTKCDLKIADPSCEASRSSSAGKLGDETIKQHLLKNLTLPIQLPEFDSASLKSGSSSKQSTRPQVAEVLFNPEARDFIEVQKSGMTGDTALQKILSGPHSATVLDGFPRNAIVVKTEWELVTGADSSGTVTPVELWNPDPDAIKQNEVSKDQLKQVNEWASKAQIDPDATCDPDHDYTGGKPVPLACFYSVPLCFKDIGWLYRDSEGLIVPSWTRNMQYHLILIAFHVMTREIDGWTWQTFYWSSGATEGADKERRDGNPWNTIRDARWSHYVMDTTLSATLPLETDHGPKICANPYLEGPLANGQTLNCIACHQYAYYHNPEKHNEGFGFGTLPRKILPDPKQLKNYEDSGLQTSFLWSLADSNYHPSAANRGSFSLTDILFNLKTGQTDQKSKSVR
jgi:hypothetical protein